MITKLRDREATIETLKGDLGAAMEANEDSGLSVRKLQQRVGELEAALDERDQRAVSIEVGIQNSGLGLVLIFAFFAGLGGMALIAAWWGIWHIIAGLSLAFWWTRGERRAAAENQAHSGRA